MFYFLPTTYWARRTRRGKLLTIFVIQQVHEVGIFFFLILHKRKHRESEVKGPVLDHIVREGQRKRRNSDLTLGLYLIYCNVWLQGLGISPLIPKLPQKEENANSMVFHQCVTERHLDSWIFIAFMQTHIIPSQKLKVSIHVFPSSERMQKS